MKTAGTATRGVHTLDGSPRRVRLDSRDRGTSIQSTRSAELGGCTPLSLCVGRFAKAERNRHAAIHAERETETGIQISEKVERGLKTRGNRKTEETCELKEKKTQEKRERKRKERERER